MAVSPDRALLILSIDAPETELCGAAPDRVLASLHVRHAQATWVMNDPVNSRLAEAIVGGAPHEVAIAVDSASSNSTDQLTRRLFRAQTRGLRISAIALDRIDGMTDETSAALVRLGIAAIRTRSTPAMSLASRLGQALSPASGDYPQPSPRRWGLWELPVTDDLAAAPARRIAARLERAIKQRGVMHIRLDLRDVEVRHLGVFAAWDRLLDSASAARREGRLRIEGMAAAVERLVRPRDAAPARSILRPAA